MNIAIIVAGGKGSRLSKDIPKQFIKIQGKTILEYTIEKFKKNNEINLIVIAIHKDFKSDLDNIILKNKWQDIVKIVIGGKTRQNSVFNALNFIKTKHIKNDLNNKKTSDKINVLIHDAARPLISETEISKLIEILNEEDAVSLAVPSTDTIIRVSDNTILEVPNRKEYWHIQTPQCFSFDTIYKAHLLAKNDSYATATDDTSLVLKYKLSEIKILEGSKINIKVTYPDDIDFVERNL